MRLAINMLLLLTIVLSACKAPGPTPAAAEPRVDVREPYPPGAWRLAPQGLDGVGVTLSHILVTHEHSLLDASTNLRGPGWVADRPSNRTREEALERIARLAVEARAHPEQFARLARQSDDLSTAATGGSLGTWVASLLPEPFLDALAAMKPLEVSRIVETPLGFHILHLRRLAPRVLVSARRVLIGYQPTAPFHVRDGRAILRTRDEAHQLAQEVFDRAKRNPAAFDALVDTYSDHIDALRHGDIGLWDSQSAFPNNREIEAIAQVSVGEVVGPIDSMEGFSVFLRTAAEERPTFAVERIVLREPAGAKATKILADTILSEVLAAPERFAMYQQKYCCTEPEQWASGRGDPRAERAVRHLGLGDIARAPIELAGGQIQILRRVSATQPARIEPLGSKLPAPKHADLSMLAQRVADAEALARTVAMIASEVRRDLDSKMSREQQTEFAALVERLARELRLVPADQRTQVMRLAFDEISTLLGAELYDAMLSSVDRTLIRGPRASR